MLWDTKECCDSVKGKLRTISVLCLLKEYAGDHKGGFFGGNWDRLRTHRVLRWLPG